MRNFQNSVGGRNQNDIVFKAGLVKNLISTINIHLDWINEYKYDINLEIRQSSYYGPFKLPLSSLYIYQWVVAYIHLIKAATSLTNSGLNASQK